MAVFVKNFAKSLLTNTLPTGVERKMPNLMDVTQQAKDNVENAKDIFANLKQKASEVQQSFAGIGSIHKTALKQLKSGKFGTDPEEQERQMMKAMGFDMDSFESFGGEPEASPNDETTKDDYASPVVQKSYYLGASSDDGQTTSAIAAGTAITAHGLSSVAGILSNIAQEISLIGAYHREKTSAFYEHNVEASKAIIAGQEKHIAEAAKMHEHYKRLADHAAMRQAGIKSVNDVMNPLAGLQNFGAEGTASGMMLEMLKSSISGTIQDPLGTLSQAMLFGSMFNDGIVDKFFGPQIQKVERFAANLPYWMQGKMEAWSAGRDYSGDFNMNNILASIGDALKVDMSRPAVKMNRDQDGPTQFDTKTRRAIVTEIPGYLAMIHQELREMTGMFGRAWGTEKSGVGRMIYDNKRGSFFDDGKLKKTVQRDIRHIVRGEGYGGLSSTLNSIISGANVMAASNGEEGISKFDAGRLRLHMLRLANSDLSGNVDLKDSKNIMENILQSYKQDMKRKNGESAEDFQTRQTATLARLETRLKGSVEKLSGFMQNANDPEAAKEMMRVKVDKMKADAAKIDDQTERKKRFAEIEKERKRMLKDIREGSFGSDSVNEFSDAFIRHKYDLREKADQYGRMQDGTAISKVVALDPRLVNVKGPKSYKNFTKLTVKDMVEQAKKEMGKGGKEARSVFNQITGTFSDLFDKIKDWGSAAVSKVGSFFSTVGLNVKAAVMSMYEKGAFSEIKEKAGKISFWEAFKTAFDKKILFPVKKWLMGGDEEAAKKMSFFQALSSGAERTVFLPIRKWLMGGDEEAAKKNNMWTALKFALDKYIGQPLKGWLFGEDGKQKTFFKNFTDTFGPKINRILFGDEKSEKNTLWGNIKNSFKEAGQFIQNRVWSPLKNWFTKELVPSIKDLINEFGISVKNIFGKVNNFITKDLVKGAKGIMNEILGEDTIQKIRKNLVEPFTKAVNKLTEGLGNVLRFFLRLPVNFFNGIADSIRLNRLKKGEGNFSEVEKARLMDLDKKGTTFNFMDGVKKTAKAPDVKKDYENIGKDAAEGFSQGLESGKDGVPTATKEVFENTVEGVKNFLDIHSPSRLMKKIGEFTAEGFVNGVKSKAQAAKDAFKSLLGADADVVRNKGTSTNGDPAEGHNRTLERIAKDVEASLGEDKEHTKLLSSIKNILSDIRDGGGTGSGGERKTKYSFFKNPLLWVGQKLEAILRTPFKFMLGIADKMKDLTGQLMKLPGKILDFSKSLVGGILDRIGKILPGLGTMVSVALNGIVKTTSKFLSKAADTATRFLSSVGETATKILGKTLDAGVALFKTTMTAIKPITDQLIKMGAMIMKGLNPVVTKLIDAFGQLATGAINLTKDFLNLGLRIGRSVFNAANRAISGVFGWKVGGAGGPMAERVDVNVLNWRGMVGASKRDPLYVHVVDGQIVTYQKQKRKMGFTDNKESFSEALSGLSSKKKDEKKEDEKSELFDAAKDIATTAAGDLIGRAVSKIGGVITPLPGKLGGKIGGAAGKLKDKIVGKKAAETVEVAANVSGKGAGKAVTEGAVKSGVMDKIGSFFSKTGSNLAKGGLAKFLTPKALTVGGLAAMGVEAIAGEDSVVGGITGILGNVATGTALGAWAGPIGMIVGGAVGLILSPIKKIMTGMRKWIESTFEKEINDLTTGFLEFPDKLTKWLDELPERVERWTEKLPEKILSFFEPPETKDIDPNTGLPVEERPSILWKMVKALGTAGLTLVKNAPRIGVAMLETITKGLMAFTITSVGFLGKGAMKFGFWIQNLFDDFVHGLGNSIANVEIKIFGKKFRPFSSFGETKEETEARITAREKAQEVKLRTIDDGTKSLVQGANGIVGAAFSPARNLTKALAGSNGDQSARSQNRYWQSIKEANGNEEKAKEIYAKRFLQMDDKAIEAAKKDGTLEKKLKDTGFYDGKAMQDSEDSKVLERRYTAYLKQNRLEDNDQSRAQFMNLVASEKLVQQNKVVDPSKFGTKEVADAIRQASQTHGIPLDLMTKMAIIESGMDPRATNPSGAKGLYQFIPSTAKEYGIAGQEFNPYANADAAARFFKSNMSYMSRAGIPINATTMYLAHQQGPGGVRNVWLAAQGKRKLDGNDLKRMAPNDPWGEGKAREARAFIAGWEKKIEGTTRMVPELAATTASIKVDSRIAAMNQGGPAAVSTALANNTTSTSASPAAAVATVAKANPQPVTPAAYAQTANEAGVNSRAPTPSTPAMMVTSNGIPVPTLAASSANNPLTQTAANESFRKTQTSSEAMGNAMVQTAPVVREAQTTENPVVAELRKQTELLMKLVGNTGGMTDQLKEGLIEALKTQAATLQVALEGGAGSKPQETLRRRGGDFFGNFSGESGSLRPSRDAIRLASGLNIPDSQTIST